MTFTVDEHGNVTKREGLEEGESANAVIMKDAPSEVSIVKVGKDGDAAQELPGADMKLTYEGNADLSHVTAENGKIEGNAAGSKVITWTSGDKAILLKQLPDGKYTLEETIAPDGYELTTKITFEVVDGKVQNVEVGESKTNKYDETTGLITMFDALKPGVTIGKQSINGTEELDGAELKLIAPKDADLSKVKASYGDDSVAAIQVKDNTITWTSDAAKGGVTLANLPAGTYTQKNFRGFYYVCAKKKFNNLIKHNRNYL